MTRVEKQEVIDQLTTTLTEGNIVYITDISNLNAENTSKLRRACYSKNIQLRVVKNTLLQKAMEKVEGKDFSGLYEVLKGNTAIMLSETGNSPAKLIKDFRKKLEIPAIKGAYIEEAIFIGDDKIETLINLKSKDELLGDIIALLQSPAKNVISALGSGGTTIAGLVKTLQERNQN